MNRQAFYNLLNIFSRSINFFLLWIILNRIGASSVTDWFFFVYGFIYFCIGITFYSLECALVPIWNNLTSKDRHDFIRTCILLGGFLLIIFQIAGLIFSLNLPSIFGFVNPFGMSRTIQLSVLLFLQPALAYFTALFSSLLQSKGYYFWPISHLVWRTLGTLVILFLTNCTDVFCLAIAYTFGESLRLFVLFFASRKYIGKPSFFKHLDIRRYQQYFISIGWMALMVCASSLNAYIDFIMVGHLGDGNATLVEYSGRLRGLPLLALNGYFVVILGDWSRQHGKNLSFGKIIRSTLIISLLGLLMSGGLILCRHYWLPLVFRMNQFDPNQMAIINRLILWYLIGAPFVIASNLFSRGFLVWQRFKLLSYISIILVFVNVLLNIIFIKLFGVTGVAMSTAGLDLILFCTFFFAGKKISDSKKAFFNQQLCTND